MLNPNKKNASRGFTLIELLVSISIFTLLSSFMVVKYRDNEAARALQNDARLAVAGLQQAQNMALTGQTVGNESPQAYRFEIVDCASACSYSLSALMAGDSVVAISTVGLKSSAVATSRPGGKLSVDFSPPRGQMAISPDNPQSAAFKVSNSQASYCVKINAVSGRIDSIPMDANSGVCP